MTGAQSLRLYRGAVILFLAAGLIAAVNAATYMVGDDAGTWTIPATTNDLNYTAWAESRNFRFGDDLIFRYSTATHDVLLVNASAYETCLLEDPLDSYSSGNDTITLNRPGMRDYFFVCGGPSHCWLQQKLHVTLVGSVPEALAAPKGGSTPPPPSAAGPRPRPASGSVKLAAIAALLLVLLTSTTLT
ncbi:hypothetical protein MPTK1_6g07510 [Marchantia polymorpha subsp. ruderalis]|uniref:Phytocyanin domain-containing protein n=2 Tax=Marchantia polymorpha TaxID=3197 RepID=A0AAF6BPJ5_MARPO|nr:hypothetical protein MARPO_0053s0065 [Marchantia polymorpha]BBN13929.1 hypothetical protein Mp_6g07510 [Marchantia polymorpha subsp. ruderalis]|eukprot:PTQ38131.1 hypothetical protein MARPO_0053s0065 [Marchantia polymorpha]